MHSTNEVTEDSLGITRKVGEADFIRKDVLTQSHETRITPDYLQDLKVVVTRADLPLGTKRKVTT